MAPRRGAQNQNSLSPAEAITSSPSSPASYLNGGTARSASPSNGFTQLFTKPTKWFNRSNSGGVGRTSVSSSEPRSSTSSTRKHKISHPTDPRPIVDSLLPPDRGGLAGASRSVVDLSLARTTSAMPDSRPYANRTPSSPPPLSFSRGLGDLRNMSRKAWSKSADDLGQISASASSPALTPIDTSLHQKIKTYRSDSVSSSIASPSPIPSPSASSLNTNYPFPVISGDISTSPPKNTRLGPPSSNPSPITPPLTPASSTSSHVHSRSHSFTPRLPSKLSAQKTNLMPPSPQRKGSASSESRDPERDKGSVGSGSSSRSPFPFGFGAAGAHAKLSPSAIFVPDGILSQGPSSPTLLAPPTIIEPEAGDSKSENRTSQMVYQSGFINRMTDFSPAMLNTRAHHAYMAGGAPAVLVKGWKPFKLVLKGSKLYFYKPPGDRSAAIKELFPTELVAVIEGEGVGELQAEVDLQDSEMDMGGRGGGGGKGKEREDMRRRRAYWGRGTHPALVLRGIEVEKGTAEALVHEAVFATTFVVPADRPSQVGGAQEDAPEASRYRPEWRDFAADIVLSLPSLIGKAVFEAELLRCCTNLLNGAAEDAKPEETQRVEWLAARYIDYHGGAENQQAWDAWQREAIPNFSPDVSKVSGLPASISMTAMHTPSPLLPSSSGPEESSPDLGAFSPRPGQGRMQSITEAYNEATPQKAGLSPPPSNPSSLSPEALRMALEEEGLSRDVLLSLDPALLARSLFVAQRTALQEVPDNFTADYVLGPGLQEAGSSAPAHQAIIPFTGSDERPHWLTRLVLIQVLVPEPASNSHGASTQLHHDRPTSRTHTRSDVISAWTRVGELARRTGDDCSWRAIMAALCARPIARLDKVWKRVDPEAMSIVQSWVQILVRGDQPTTTASLAYPWVGDAQREIREALEKARGGDGDEWVVRYLRDVREQFNAVRTTFALCTKRADFGSAAEFPGVDVLAKHWQALAFEGDSRGLAAKFLRTEQFMSLSSAAEPRRRGIFEPYFWSRMSLQPSIHPLAALLFPEPLPAVSFVNRSQIMRGRLESNSSGLNIQDIRDLRSHLDGERTSQSERPKLGGFDLGGTVIPVYGGELLLLVQPGGDAVPSSRPASRAPSRPPSSAAPDTPSLERSFSRNPSIRVTPGSSHGHGSERKSSMARRNSLPSMSQRTSLVASEITSERPLRVVVQAGTLDRLVDVLVHGLQGVSVSVADDNGEMPLTDRKTREVRVDMDDFSQVWWNNFRSFLKPQVLFELLRKRYVGAHQAGRPLTSDEISHAVRLRMEVLEIMGEWVAQGGGAQDALDDAGLYDAFLAFLTQPTEQKLLESAASDTDTEVSQAVKALDLARKTLHMSFLSQTLRPIPRTPAAPDSTLDGLGAISYGSDLPDIDQLDAEELVNNLNSMASATLRNVTQEDLFVTADLFEVQSADRTGWFLARDPSSIADEVEIQSMSSYILEVEPSELISELAQDNLYRLLPPAVRSCIRAFGILRKWLVSKLVALRIGIQARQQRMELMLRAIEVCRRRNADSESADALSTEQPCVRSFVESMLTSAVLSIESRSYQRAWLGVAVIRGSGCDTLAAYLARPVLQSLSSRGPLAPDIGWLMEKVLEIISLPDVLEAPAVEPVTLVNFEKRRTLQTLLTSVSGAAAGRRQRRRENDRRDFERLNNMEKELGTVHFDMRAIREDAYRESGQASVTPSKRAQRPFQMLVAQQQEKNRRDRLWRDRLSKEKRQEQMKNDRREEQLNKAMHQRRPNPVMPKQHRNKKSMSSAFFQFMRPISSAFTSDTMSGSPAKRWTPAELDFAPSHKPSLVLSVVGARVAHFINNERSFVFQIDSEDGGHYLLQAASQQEMKKWTETIERVSKITAKRRLTYLGQNTKPQLAEHLLTKPAVATRDPYAVFGVELDFLLQRESSDGEVPAGTVPVVLERLINEVEQRGLTEVGIYRIAGAHSEVNTLRDALNRGEWPISELTDIHAVCDLIKSWFRVLPGGLFPADTYGAILNAAATGRDDVDLQTKVANVREIVHTLPGANFDLLKRIVEHLERVTDYEESNQMTTESLATVFSPNLLRSTNNDVGTFFSNMAAGHRITKMLIAHFHVIFDNDIEQEQDADADAEQEAEECDFDEPILEEDEEEEDLFRDSVDELPPKLPSEPPVLSINLGSPASLSFNMS